MVEWKVVGEVKGEVEVEVEVEVKGKMKAEVKGEMKVKDGNTRWKHKVETQGEGGKHNITADERHLRMVRQPQEIDPCQGGVS